MKTQFDNGGNPLPSEDMGGTILNHPLPKDEFNIMANKGADYLKFFDPENQKMKEVKMDSMRLGLVMKIKKWGQKLREKLDLF